MDNIVFLETYTSYDEFIQSHKLAIPLQSFITYCLFKYCAPAEVKLEFISCPQSKSEEAVYLNNYDDTLVFADLLNVPWQVTSCVYPVVMCEDTIITGLCAVARHITKYRSRPQSPKEHEEGLLGFRKGCLQVPNEASVWTKFCEVDIIKTAKEILAAVNNKTNNDLTEKLYEVSKPLVCFESHLSKPVRVHNVYKMARDINKNKKNIETKVEVADSLSSLEKKETSRAAKPRKWKSNTKKELQIESSVKIEDLGISHQFAEGPFFTLADMVLLPSYHIIMQALGQDVFKSHLPLTFKWFTNLLEQPEIQIIRDLMNMVESKVLFIENIFVPEMQGVSLYKRDPSRHNPKKRLFTKEHDIENALSALVEGMELNITANNFDSEVNWNDIPDGANPTAGHLPDARIIRKSQQLENLTLPVLDIAKDGDIIVDFCSGSGHLGILIAYLLPKCTIILLENKEQSLLRARKRVHEMKLKNVFFFQCNLDFFNGKFDIGIALHACGIATDLVLDKCLKANAKFVLCPCCYGSLHSTDRLAYPRSNNFSNVNIDQYLCIGHAADQTHEEHPLMVRGSRCMAIIDSDRARLAEEFGYKVTLSRLKPLTCTPKNNLLIGIPA
ncbi:glutathione S-transferase C-terminal domain-containing protein homolog [Ostrinia furnacalis]|uniref:glutathione S-transferase C-terminal domain-containing protein homolog n=1 Tax=Ostrinia furnacalis TaxID=93504 RepID=UPI00103B4CAD|nr:glutathione S-transferase C-terminal domain-containing protein homolog [Ostrinia furnacalis]